MLPPDLAANGRRAAQRKRALILSQRSSRNSVSDPFGVKFSSSTWRWREPMTPIRTIIAAAVALGTLAAPGQAGATSLAVKMACASDYYANCSQHSPDSPGVRKCMRAVGAASPRAASTPSSPPVKFPSRSSRRRSPRSKPIEFSARSAGASLHASADFASALTRISAISRRRCRRVFPRSACSVALTRLG